MKVYVEGGSKRTFVGAIDWPGWDRGAKTEEAALEAFIDYGPRYVAAIGNPARGLKLPKSVKDLDIRTRLKGGSGTDFGVPSTVSDFDRAELSADDLAELAKVLRAAWRAFETAASKAKGTKLRPSGPRGGGRALDKIVEHVREADEAYIASLGARPPRNAEWATLQRALIDALAAKIRGELPERGPRGGERWPARYAIRRSAWHALDHAWEIEDRASDQSG